MAHPKVGDWKAEDSVLRAGVRGFNVLTELPRILKNQYRWLNDFEMGFFIEDDVPHMRSIGWGFLKKEHFDIENFNEAIGLGHGLTTDGTDNIKWRDNYLMIMPKNFRQKLVNIRNTMHEEQFTRDVEGGAYVPPGSKEPQKQWIEEQSKEAFESAKVINRGEAAKPGRKPKPVEA
jgi:hypothetical protein